MSFLKISVFGAAASALTLACTASAPPPASNGNSAVTAGHSSESNAPDPEGPLSKTPPPSASPAPAKAGNAPNTAQCAATANHEDCSTCCEGPNSESTKAKDDAFNQCLCNAAKATCPAECAAGYCHPDGTAGTASVGGPGTVDPCASCLPDAGACDAQAKKACDADPTCAAAEKCYADAKCDSKPPGPDEGSSEATDSSSSSDGQ
jgi:hypothetical protein